MGETNQNRGHGDSSHDTSRTRGSKYQDSKSYSNTQRTRKKTGASSNGQGHGDDHYGRTRNTETQSTRHSTYQTSRSITLKEDQDSRANTATATQSAGSSRKTGTTQQITNDPSSSRTQTTRTMTHPPIGTTITMLKVAKGPCPQGFVWIKIHGGYRCWAGGHWLTDDQMEVYQEVLDRWGPLSDKWW